MSEADDVEKQPLVPRGHGGSDDAPTSSTPRKKGRHWTLNNAINRIGVGPFQIGILLLCGASEIANGIQQLSVSFLLHHLGTLFHLSNHGKALIGTMSGAGMLVGAISFGRISDIKGRRYAFTISLLMSGGFGLLAAAAPNFTTFLIMRAFLSIGVGGNVPLAFTIFTEFSAKQNRGMFLTSLEAFWSFGAVISCIFAWAILPNLGWKYYQMVCAIPALVLAFVVLFYMPESPRYHVVTGNVRSAQLTLHRMAEANGKPKLKEFQLGASLQEQTFTPSFADLFSPQYLRTTLLLFGLFFCLSFGCGVFVWLPVLLETKHLAVMSMYRSMVIMALSQIPGVLATAYVVEYIGRKRAIMITFSFGALSMIIFGLSQALGLVVMGSIFMEFFLAGANGSLSAYTVEVYPTTLRSSAMGACSSLARFSAIINPTIWATLLDISTELAIFAGAGLLLVGCGLIQMLRHETKTMDLADTTSSKKQN